MLPSKNDSANGKSLYMFIKTASAAMLVIWRNALPVDEQGYVRVRVL
jgi:hypothetical protein